MAVTSSSEPQASDPPAEAWLAELEDQIADEESWGDQRNTEAASIILHMLTSFPEKGYVAALEAALKIGADYWARFLPSSQDPLRKPYRLEDKGMPEYLAHLYDLILHQSWLLPYYDERQDLLTRFLVELSHLPKVTYKSEGVCLMPLIMCSRKLLPMLSTCLGRISRFPQRPCVRNNVRRRMEWEIW